jgi:hypothetical protein
MTTNGYVSVNVIDNGGAAIVVPSQSLQLVIACSSAGTVGQITATKSPITLGSTFGWGPLPESSGLAALGGATILAIRATSATAGAATSVTHTGSGTSIVTLSGTPYDTYYVQVNVVLGGTIGTGPITLAISLDAGRTFSPNISLGTANIYAIPGTNITLNFAAGTTITGDTYAFSTTEPLWNTAGILAALTAFAQSPYGQIGVGSIHIAGGSTVGGTPGADATTIGGYLEGSVVGATATLPFFNDAIVNARDAHPPTAWGGAGETEATWMTAIESDYSAVSQKRITCCAGFFNMPSALVNPLGFIPRFRRPLSYAIAQRATQIQAQRSWGRVKDGPLAPIVVSPTTDPNDGFIYHNDANFAPAGLGDFRFTTSTLRSGSNAIYARSAATMALTGSQYSQRPYMAVANVASEIIQQTGQQVVNDNVRLLPSGAIDPRDAQKIQASILGAINANMTSAQMITSATCVVDQTNNVQSTGQVNVTVTLVARGLVLTVNATLQYSNPNQAQAA